MKKCLSLLLIVSITIYSYGCYSYNIEEKENLSSDLKIDSVVMLDGKIVKFDVRGARYDETNMKIIGISTDYFYMEIPNEQVLSVKVKRIDALKTTFFVISIPLVLFIILLETVEFEPNPNPNPNP